MADKFQTDKLQKLDELLKAIVLRSDDGDKEEVAVLVFECRSLVYDLAKAAAWTPA